MAPTPLKLDGIRIQTARMLEIYALLRRELEENTHLHLTPEDLERLHGAIASVEANMRELQAYIVTHLEENSPEEAEARELGEILDSVLKWAHEEGE